MTAYPYPKTGKSSFWLVTFIKGMSSLLNNTADKVTFPAWQISIYDPMEPNFNSWQNMLENTQCGRFKWNSEKTVDSVANQLKFYPHEQRGLWLEVTHSCYAPPKCSYPVCDDGGYWLYGCSGSGVFWNCITRKNSIVPEGKSQKFGIIGGCVVCNNKIDAMFKLWNYLKDLSTTFSISKYKDILLNSQKAAGISGDTIIQAEDYLIARLKGSGGGNSLTKAMREIIAAFHRGKQIPKITAWRSMEPQKAYIGWYTFCIFSITLLVLFMLIVVNFFKVIIDTFRGKKPWWKIVLNLAVLIFTAIIFVTIEWSVLTEFMFTHFGYTTMEMALKKSNLSLKDFIFSSAGLDKNYNALPPGNYNPISNGLAQIQNFDFDLSALSSISGLDSIIMHTQPNKSGSWSVEILDIRNTPVPLKLKSLDKLIYKLGICGSPVKSNLSETTEESSKDSCQVNNSAKDLMPPLAKGPIVDTSSVHCSSSGSSSQGHFIYFGYQPKINLFNQPEKNNKCNCNDNVVTTQLNTDGTLKKCVYCEGTISQQLC